MWKPHFRTTPHEPKNMLNISFSLSAHNATQIRKKIGAGQMLQHRMSKSQFYKQGHAQAQATGAENHPGTGVIICPIPQDSPWKHDQSKQFQRQVSLRWNECSNTPRQLITTLSREKRDQTYCKDISWNTNHPNGRSHTQDWDAYIWGPKVSKLIRYRSQN